MENFANEFVSKLDGKISDVDEWSSGFEFGPGEKGDKGDKRKS